MRKRLTIVLAVIGLLAVSGIALAADDEGDDTVFNYGYDQENQVLLWNANPTDGRYDCSLEVKGNLTTTYGLTEDGLVVVTGLNDASAAVVTFSPTPAGEVADDLEPAIGDVDYTGPDGECVVGGGVVAGPNGQVNHGSFMKLFNSLYEGGHRGCVVRHLAQSHLGKGDQQVKVSEVDPEAEALAEGDGGEVQFATALADCEHGNADNTGESEQLTGQEKAAAKKAAKADHPHGNSGNAPGKNK